MIILTVSPSRLIRQDPNQSDCTAPLSSNGSAPRAPAERRVRGTRRFRRCTSVCSILPFSCPPSPPHPPPPSIHSPPRPRHASFTLAQRQGEGAAECVDVLTAGSVAHRDRGEAKRSAGYACRTARDANASVCCLAEGARAADGAASGALRDVTRPFFRFEGLGSV